MKFVKTEVPKKGFECVKSVNKVEIHYTKILEMKIYSPHR
jgi:hypothetical protein